MISEAQQAAKLEAREHFRGMQYLAEGAGADAPMIPLDTALAGVGVAGESIRIYVLEDRVHDIEIPERFGGLHTELVPTSGFQADPPVAAVAAPARPVACGVSVGHVNISAGTLGCLVTIGGNRYVLGNNHVLADTNAGAAGDDVVQPGPADGGAAPIDVIARLHDFEPIDFGRGAVNRMDAATARLIDPALVNPDILTIGCPANPPVSGTLGQPVKKHGRTTGYTTGKIVDESFDGHVRYGAGTAWFENQIAVQSETGPFSQPGDSGALIVDHLSSRPVALLFAGDSRVTLGNPIDLVLSRFRATIVDR